MSHPNSKFSNLYTTKACKSVMVSTQSLRPSNCCRIDLKKQTKVSKRLADEDYLKALKIHQDPRKTDLNVSFEILNSVDKLVSQKIRPKSVEPNQRLSFENWKKNKMIEHKLRKFYLKKKLGSSTNLFKSGKIKGEKELLEGNGSVFRLWLKKKIQEKKREKKEKKIECQREKIEKSRMMGEGLSYRQWLKVSLQKEKMERRRKVEEDLKEDIRKQEIDEQRSYEKQARRYVEREKLRQRLSKLCVRRHFESSEERHYSHSPLLLAYSPNKYNKVQDRSFSGNSKFSAAEEY